MPEGEAPSPGAGKGGLTGLGVLATTLRFNDEHPGRKILIAGHTDTTGTVDFNQKLSEERAQAVLALLIGGDEQRAAWQDLCQNRHTVSDYKQILAWLARTFPSRFSGCDPHAVNDDATTGVTAVRAFQNAYNANKQDLGPTQADLDPDGVVGPFTWGALFDCYQFGLRAELGTDEAGVKALRDKLVFVDDDHKALGFSEHFPIDELGVDNFRSQANRRVEVLFFESGEEPDVPSLADDPETAEIYLPGRYERQPLEPSLDDFIELEVRLHDLDARPLGAVPCRVTLGDKTQTLTATEDGFVKLGLPALSCPDRAHIEWGTPLADGTFPFERDLAVECDEGDEKQQAATKLFNLGYASLDDGDFEQAVKDFQFDYDVAETGTDSGELLPATRSKLFGIYTTDCNATRPDADQPTPDADDDDDDEHQIGAGSCFDGLG